MKIAIYGQYYQNDTRPIIRDIFVFLNQKKVQLIIEYNFLQVLYQEQIITKSYETFVSSNELIDVDLLLSIGGDGTILRAVTYVRDTGIPILGVNAGRLGFLAKVQKENIESLLETILNKKYAISNRSMLCLETSVANEHIANTPFALNEITVSRKDTTAMITIETYLNGEYLTSYWADGLIISTPTGSTGYSLSCGGPVLMPTVNSLVLTPIAPHNLNARPLVIPNTTEIMLKVQSREPQYLVSLDSRIATLQGETTLHIKRNSFDVQMVELPEETFIKTLRQKLLWGEDKRN